MGFMQVGVEVKDVVLVPKLMPLKLQLRHV